MSATKGPAPSSSTITATMNRDASKAAAVNEITQTLAPSHILPDGRFVFLPPPTDRERAQFFERSIARHGLLQEDLTGQENERKDDEKDIKHDEPKVHPLALASARLQGNGINELNRAINLATLVSTGEYFGLSNIVDPSLEIPAGTTKTKSSTDANNAPQSTSTAAVANNMSASAAIDKEPGNAKAQYLCKRKRTQFEQASLVLKRHADRLQAAIVTQAQPDERLRQLRRKYWRLVAPEHGTRALPHAARPTEVVACDVDIYDNISNAAISTHAGGGGLALGRLARRVPRYATMEIKEDFAIEQELKKWKDLHFRDKNEMDVDEENDEKNVKMDEDIDNDTKEILSQASTYAEPFAIADPALGKLDADFDPKKVSMLTLQFNIEKDSTGFCQSATLQPFSYSEDGILHDEKVLTALQHSLFCAKLFESVRRELAPDTEEIGQIRSNTTAQSLSHKQIAWLSCEADENFLPAPSLMAHGRSDLPPLCVVYCHEGEVKVQLDSEYTLCVRLVAANQSQSGDNSNNSEIDSFDSGSQSPAQLHLLCRVLLLHAQKCYHQHAIKVASLLQEQQQQKELKQQQQQYVAHVVKSNHTMIQSAHILQECVSLGNKLLLERHLRETLKRTQSWLHESMNCTEPLQVEWLALPVFDWQSHFTLAFRSYCMDAEIWCGEVTVTSCTDGYRKATFYADVELELFLKLKLQTMLQEQ